MAFSRWLRIRFLEQKNFFINLGIGRRCLIDALVTSLNLLSARNDGIWYLFGLRVKDSKEIIGTEDHDKQRYRKWSTSI